MLLFRLTALDRRLPLFAGLITASLATVLALPQNSQTIILLIVPAALLWLARTTVQHARAKEDHLRRIDEIERAINEIAGEHLLMFQSRHPSRGRTPAGRTGNSTVVATTFGTLFILLFSLFLFLETPRPVPDWIYVSYLVLVMLGVSIGPVRLSKYHYRKRPPELILPNN
ncbi:hypothetical protein [Stieleria maiorica]|uniref:hypothetical protein n=1 Tax=Stieleria maiorica TaxID=2795974 RepID=UPI0011CC2945|nr:hypothetical protein [Stieleria maiorica]